MEHRITRRKFAIKTMVAAAGALTWEPLFSIGRAAPAATSRRLSLNGEWQVSQAGKNVWIPAAVPGGAYTDLLAAGKIPDPFYRENEKVVQWVGECGWDYRRTFDVPEEVLNNDR